MKIDADHPGSFTLVSGAPLSRVLRVLEATPSTAPDPVDDPSAGGSGLARVSVVGEHVVIWEPNGFLGNLESVLRPLSKGGAAVNAFWDVNGTVTVQSASRGRSGWLVEFPVEDVSAVPPRLRKLVRSVLDRVSDDEMERQAYEVACMVQGLNPETVSSQDGEWFDLQVSPVVMMDAAGIIEESLETSTSREEDGPFFPKWLADRVLSLDPAAAERLAQKVARAVIAEAGVPDLDALGARLDGGDPSAFATLYRLRRDAGQAANAAAEDFYDALYAEIDFDVEAGRARMRDWGPPLWRSEALLYAYTGKGRQAAAGVIQRGLRVTKEPEEFLKMCGFLLEQ